MTALLPADVVPTAPAPARTCRDCGRPITDPISVARQVGSSCWAKAHPDAQGATRSTAGVGERDLLDEMEMSVDDQNGPEVREYTEWGMRVDAVGNPGMSSSIGHVEPVRSDGSDADRRAIAEMHAANFRAWPGCAATVVSRRVRVVTERGEWVEAR